MILSKLNNLQQRLVVSSFAVIGILVIISLSYNNFFAPIFALLAAATIGLAQWEYYDIAKIKHCQPLIKIGLIGTVAYVFAIFLRAHFHFAKMFPEIALGLILVSCFIYYFIKGTDPFVNLAITLFGILYLTIPLSCLIDINYFKSEPLVTDGRWALVYLLLVTKMTDTGAFFIGKMYGKRKLSPYISPKKTWEGAFGGLAGALITSIVLYILLHLFAVAPPINLSFWQSLWLAALISVAAQFGDLAESLLKRDVGVKDSSHLPGLGGMLDVVDSLVFTSPLMYIFLKING